MAERVVTLLLNYRTAGMTLACLHDLRETAAEHPVLLIDNGSGAAEAAQLTEGVQGIPAVELRLFEKNLGYCAAMNAGIEWAKDRGADSIFRKAVVPVAIAWRPTSRIARRSTPTPTTAPTRPPSSTPIAWPRACP